MKAQTKFIGKLLVLSTVLLMSAAVNSDAAPAPAPSADWNQWRGPDRNGVAAGGPKLSALWSEKGPELVWQSEPIPSGGDGGFGSCVTYKNRVYLFVNWKRYQNQGGAADVVVCLDANTGKTLWKTAFPGREYGFGTSSTPCVYDGKVYAVGGNGMYCLDAATGAEIWKVPSVGNELSSSPTIVGGVLVVSTGTLKGFDPATGKELWACVQAGTGNGNNTSPGVWVTGKGPLLITNMGRLTCVNPKDGSVVWQSEGADHTSTPAVAGDVCIVGSALAGYRLLPDKAEKLFGSGLSDRGASHFLYNDHVFAYAGGALRCLDLTGKELWAQAVGGEISSPVLAGGNIFAVCGDDKLVMTSATAAKPAKFNEARVPVLQCTSPAVADGKLFLRLKTAVACYDLTKGPVDPSTLPPAPAVTPKNAVPGLQVAYYVGGDLGSALNLDAAAPAKTGTVSVIDMAFAEAKENFGLKFTGYVNVPKDGEYTFFTNSDDGSRLFIGKIEVVNNDGMHAPKEESGSIRLKAGKHPIRVYFMQGGGGSALSVSYEGPGIAKSQIPSQALFRDAD